MHHVRMHALRISGKPPSTESCFAYLAQGLHDIVHVNIAKNDSQIEAFVKLLNSMVYILWFEQMKPTSSSKPVLKFR